MSALRAPAHNYNPKARACVHPHGARLRLVIDELAQTPDINRGEQRLAAEVALHLLRGERPAGMPTDRAMHTLTVLATG